MTTDNPESVLRTINDTVLEKYLSSAFWLDDVLADQILSTDCELEFPFAPPGMPKAFPKEKRLLLLNWLRRTMSKWSRDQVVKYPTKNPSRYWVQSRTQATVTWGGIESRHFVCDHIEMVAISEGKIQRVKTWSDPLAYYLAAGINLPVFFFDGNASSSEPMPNTPARDIPSNDAEAALIVNILRILVHCISVAN